MLNKDLRKKLKFLSKRNKVEMIERSPLINEAFKDDFNYSIGEASILERFGQYLPIKENWSFSVFQPCIRLSDFNKEVKCGSPYHLAFFEMADVGGLHLSKNKNCKEIREKVIKQGYDFLTRVLGLDPDSLYINYFSGNNLKILSRNLIKSDKYIKADKETIWIWKELGFQEDHFIPDNTQKTFVLTFFPFEFYAGYRSEIFFKKPTKPYDLIEIATFEFLDFRTKLDKNGQLINICPLDGCFGGMAIGLERLLMVVNSFNDIFQCEYISPLYESVLRLSKKKNELAGRVITEAIRLLSAVIVDVDKFFNGKISKRSRRRKLKKVLNDAYAKSEALKLDFKKSWQNLFELNVKLQPWFFNRSTPHLSIETLEKIL